MPKVRKPAATAAPTSDQIEAFAAGAEAAPALDPTAPRNFKAVKVGFNEYEYQMLEAASRQSGRSKLNFIRHAMLKMAEEME